MALASSPAILAHSGPPFPIVRQHIVGAYDVSVWADPDATDDGTAAGQFWVMVRPANQSADLPAATRADVSIAPAGRAGEGRTQRAEPVNGEITRRFAVLVMDHEGPFAVHVSVDGPLGRADVDATVDATYDLRPTPVLLVVYLLPFLVVGGLWGKLLLRRRQSRARE